MADLQASNFREFFIDLHGYAPFPWQEALAKKVCAEGWGNVKVIDLPTASGKTACIDIALFALCVRGDEAPRRIFFVVDRRVIVNEAYLRISDVRNKLKKAKTGVLREVADRFYRLAGVEPEHEKDEDPLLVSEMRGGVFRDEAWVRNPLQPTVVASTVDQVGSRLLFRGYGVGQNSWPMHAGLIANDALIFLDEAHCSRAFAQTLKSVKRYREWASNPIHKPFHFVQMTATPSEPVNAEEIFVLTDADHNLDKLKERLQAAKPTCLIKAIGGKKENFANLAEQLVEQAIKLKNEAQAKRVAIFVNRVKTAKEVYKQLREDKNLSGAQVELVIGSMRPVDRDDLYDRKLNTLKSGVKRKPDDPLTFVVSTQCLEVGADLDFDVLVSEGASIDALLQRFGRLDRLGAFGRAQGAIVVSPWQISPKQPDPVYRETLSETWNWLSSIADEKSTINMGIESRPGEPPTIKQKLDALDNKAQRSLRLIGQAAPVLLPAHVDMLAQTSPVPEPSPLVQFFLHGPKRGVPDVQVVWRCDLEDAQNDDQATEIVKLCPPSSREAMTISINSFQKWFAGQKDFDANESDLEIGAEEAPPEQQQKNIPYALAWDGEKCRRIRDAKKIEPGQTIILKKSSEAWRELGHIPDGAPIDVGDRAAFETRNAISLRLHPELMKEWPETPELQSLVEDLRQPDLQWKELKIRLRTYREQLKQKRKEIPEEKPPSWLDGVLDALDQLRRPQLDLYPGQKIIYALRARRGKARQRNGDQVLLKDHLKDVEIAAKEISSSLPANLHDALCASALLHDYGKVDVRYQAWLCNGNLAAARLLPEPLAKSGKDVLIKQTSVKLPEGFRHELLSLMFAEKHLSQSAEMRDLILHLVAAHHGRCRPFAPVYPDSGVECVSYNKLSICKEERIKNAPHRLGRGVSDRFWKLTGQYGWWGLAYLEALLRLADWKASENEAAEVSNG